MDFAQRIKSVKKTGVPYTKEDIMEMIISFSYDMIFDLYDHFSELCTSTNTIELLLKKEYKETSKKLKRLIIVKNTRNHELFMKEAESIIKSSKDIICNNMVELIAYNYLLDNPSLPYNKRQQIKDKIYKKTIPILFHNN